MTTKSKRGLRFFLPALTLSLTLSACSGGNSPDASPAESSASATSTSSASPAATGKYDPAIELSTVRVLYDGDTFAGDVSMDNNIWYQTYDSELGIKVKNLWTVPSAQWEQKMNITIASNNIPDFMAVNSKQLNQLMKSDMIQDLTQAYNDYATPLTRQIMESDNGIGMKSATFQGKLMALPSMSSSLDQASMIWVRTDWLTKLGLAEPKTMDDVLKISEAFTNGDPDGNGKKDTYGLAVQKELFGWLAALQGFFEGYHAYPNSWIKDASGKLVYGSVQPEVKTALAKLQEMYNAGQIDREFGVKDYGKLAEDMTANRVGLQFGMSGNAFYPYPDHVKNNPDADWKAFPIVSADDKPAKVALNNGVLQYYVVNKNVKNPEAVVKLLNFAVEKQYGEKGRDLAFWTSEDAPNLWHTAAVIGQDARQNINIYLNIKDAAANGAELSYDAKDNYDQIQKFLAGDKSFWGTYRWAGEEGSLSVLDLYDTEKRIQFNEFYGAATDTMTAKMASLDKIRLETFTRIIMGSASIDEFDKFVSQWNSLGGADITQEVNDWAASLQ
ncbi:extracellular solute-binding protein [Cohnella silvisoli]|uniref:Extracellular solute-binding protein n=1 Tax=Cohnella silvisoli TaxID=2873699 RepID=A0ABV1KTQ1_9BACL|nr:extracellular solute-binding protein [Cohnella silvisoli]MCD9022539.1 extracellular solute-binding protein [Cohnella silvisoli]